MNLSAIRGESARRSEQPHLRFTPFHPGPYFTLWLLYVGHDSPNILGNPFSFIYTQTYFKHWVVDRHSKRQVIQSCYFTVPWATYSTAERPERVMNDKPKNQKNSEHPVSISTASYFSDFVTASAKSG